MCVMSAYMASAANITKKVSGYEGEIYNLTITGDDSKLNAERLKSNNCYTTLLNTSSAYLYAYVRVSLAYSDDWGRIKSEGKTDSCLIKDEIVATPNLVGTQKGSAYGYLHEGTAYNYQNHSVIEDKLVYKVANN